MQVKNKLTPEQQKELLALALKFGKSKFYAGLVYEDAEKRIEAENKANFALFALADFVYKL